MDRRDKLCQLRLQQTSIVYFRCYLRRVSLSITKLWPQSENRFQSVELKGIEFHMRLEGKDSVDKVGIALQKLGRKDFPAAEGKRFDRLLKGRFYQAFHISGRS